MLIDLDDRCESKAPQTTETLVVGAGAVGLTLAVELARAGRRVIVLEAGGRTVEAGSQAFFKTALWRDHPLNGLHLGRFRALGGTTNFWGGRLVPFDPIVFERRPWVADVEWPVTHAELAPYYERGYDLLGVSRQLSDDAVWRRLDVAPPTWGNEAEVVFTRWAPEPNFSFLFNSDIQSSPDLHVVLNAPVVALDADDTDQRIISVVVRTSAGLEHRFSADRVILANGTVEIARLLKLPLADKRRAPWADSRWLGRGFMEHLDCFGGHVTPLDRSRFHSLFDNAYLDGIKYMPMVKLSSHVQKEKRLLGSAAQFIFNSSIREHLGNAKLLVRSLFRGRFHRHLMPDLISSARVAWPMASRYLRYRRMYNPSDQGIHLRLISEQLPLTESGIHLTERCDQLGMPIVEVDWRIDGREIETLATLGEIAARYLEQHQLARVRLDPALVARDASFLKQAQDSYHHMGTARMGNSPNEGVVDRNLTVFGTRNLFVAGAAVYPTSGFANPTFTAIALGLRLADAICRGHVPS